MTDERARIQRLESELALSSARIVELQAVLAQRRQVDEPIGRGAIPDRTAATRDLLELFARGSTRREYLDNVRHLLQCWSCCESIGLRLADGHSRIPYETHCGFDQLFYEHENWISLAHDNCACIRVVKGEPEPHDLPFMTASGSYVINDSRQFLECLTEQQKTSFRGSCMRVGYLSIAIIPIRYRGQIIGAIHMTDRRAGLFPPDLVEFIETLSPLIGEAVHRFNVEDSLRQSNELLERTFESIDLHVAYMDRGFNFIRVNRGYAAADGHNPEWFIGQNHFQLYPHPENEGIFRRVVQTGEPCFMYERPFEYARNPERGVTYWDWSLQPVKDAGGTVEGVVLCLVNVTDRKKAQQALKQLEKQVLEVSSREQRRIGQDLHDVLGQQLTGLAFLNRILEQKLAEKNLPEAEDAARISEIIKQSISQARALARVLCPIDQKAEGLMTALQAFAANIEEYYGISCRFDCPQGVLVEDMAAATHLYHIVQEASNNAVKHGKADQVTISLTAQGRTLSLSVRDNGTGIPESPRKGKGLGLSITRYRAGIVGGSLEIKPHPDGGTLVVCTCPHLAAQAEGTAGRLSQ